MSHVIGHVSIVLILLAAGCNYVAAPSPSPTPGATGTPVPMGGTSSPLAPATEPPPTDSEPPPPTASTALETSAPTETPSPSEPPNSGVWRRVTDFPPPGAHVSAVFAAGPGYVAVGYQGDEDDSYPCEEQTVDGRAWTSSDGEHWTEWRPEALAGLSLTLAVNAGGTVYAFGSGYPVCAADSVRAAVRSTDGTSWELLQPDFPDGFPMDSVGAIGGTLIAVGADSSLTSADGAHWQRSGDVPFSYSWFDEIGSLGGTAVAFDNNATRPASFSEDAGESWRQGDLAPLYNLRVVDAAVSSDRIVAVGEAFYTVPGTSAGVAMASSDGQTWQESAPMRDPPGTVAAIPGGFIAVGRTVMFSSDGLDWRVGPSLPDFDQSADVVAVSADPGLLVVNGSLAWFARHDALEVGAWDRMPPPPEMPEIGVRYPFDVVLHCGWPSIYFGLRTWLPDPPFEGEHAVNPPPGFGDVDKGWLTQLNRNELEYESKRGPKITLRPSEEPVEWGGPCA